MKIIGIIQARMGSTRLPNKVMMHFNGFPIIDWVVKRSRKSKTIKNARTNAENSSII